MQAISVGAPVKPGMRNLLAQMDRTSAAAVTKRSETLQHIESFIGPVRDGSLVRANQDAYLLSKLTDIPDVIRDLGGHLGANREELLAMWNGACSTVSSEGRDKGRFLSALGMEQSQLQLAESYFFPESHGDKMAADYDLRNYILSNLRNPGTDPEFAAAMVMANMMPIATEMIPNTIATKAFITDDAQNLFAKAYFFKKRYRAYMQGLAEEVAGLPPAEVVEYDMQMISPREWTRKLRTDIKWIETMQFDVAADNMADGGRELQILFDNAFFRALDLIVPNNPAGVPPAGSTATGWTIDADHSVMMLEANRAPQVEDLIAAAQFLRDKGFRPDLIITSSYELGVLMSQQAVLMQYAFGTREVQETGTVGKLAGLAVAYTPNLWAGGTASGNVIWICDSDELARVVLGAPISLWTDFRLRRMDWELYTRLMFFFRNANACIKIVCNNAPTVA